MVTLNGSVRKTNIHDVKDIVLRSKGAGGDSIEGGHGCHRGETVKEVCSSRAANAVNSLKMLKYSSRAANSMTILWCSSYFLCSNNCMVSSRRRRKICCKLEAVELKESTRGKVN